LLAQLLAGASVRADADPAALTAKIPTGPPASAETEQAAAAVAGLARAGIAVGEFAFAQPSLDEVFLTLTGHITQETAS
jgi:ABC-2 type transport system ATP-binding protein